MHSAPRFSGYKTGHFKFSDNITFSSIFFLLSLLSYFSAPLTMTYHSVGKSRRSSPESQSGVYYPTGHSSFQTGQGGRTVLPPLSSAFPTSRFPGLSFFPYKTIFTFNVLNFLVLYL